MIEIRPETPARDACAIESLFDLTFGPGHFARTAERLREFSCSLPALSRVALSGGEIVGVCRVWPLRIGASPALFYGPVAVHPGFRGRRLGLDVTAQALKAGAQAGWPVALLVGAPGYFGEIGFQVAPAGSIRMPGPQAGERIMLKGLAREIAGISGAVEAAPDLARSAPFPAPGPDQDRHEDKRCDQARQERGRA